MMPTKKEARRRLLEAAEKHAFTDTTSDEYPRPKVVTVRVRDLRCALFESTAGVWSVNMDPNLGWDD